MDIHAPSLPSLSSLSSLSSLPPPPAQPAPPRAPAPRARKSRYSNFAPEVDSAIGILYRELESATDLRSQLSDARTELRTLGQELRIRDNQLLLAHQQNAGRAALEDEMKQLRSAAQARGSESGAQVERLRATVRRLEAEVEALREAVRRKNRETDAWRDQLRKLIDPTPPSAPAAVGGM
jgi:septal ring factor EnvC (AmiA/AmiB activator)